MSRQSLTIPLMGGIAAGVAPGFSKPGELMDCHHFHIDPNGGYARFAGWERFDGQPSPALALDAEDREARRALIGAVPGTGPVLGVADLDGVLFAMRAAVGVDAVDLYRATETGWVGGMVRMHNQADCSVSAERIGGKSLLAIAGKLAGLWSGGYTAIPAANGARKMLAHKNHLFACFDTGIIRWSANGQPTNFSLNQGAGAFALGERFVDAISTGADLVVFGEQNIYVLAGASSEQWQLQRVAPSNGVLAGSAVLAGSQVLFVNRDGVSLLSAAQALGGFASAAVSRRLGWVKDSLAVTRFALVDSSRQAAILFGEKAHDTAVLFGDDRNLAVSFAGGEIAGFGDLQCPPAHCGCVASDGQMYIGGKDGMVYAINRGSSADGAPLFSRLHFSLIQLPDFGQRKQIHWLGLAMQAQANAGFALQLYPSFDGLGRDERQLSAKPKNADMTRLDVLAIDDTPIPLYVGKAIGGECDRLGLAIEHQGTEIDSLTISTLAVQFTPRAQER